MLFKELICSLCRINVPCGLLLLPGVRTKSIDHGTRLLAGARFVRWSDGSLQLLIGDEVLDVAEVDTTSDHSYLYSRPKQAALLEVASSFPSS